MTISRPPARGGYTLLETVFYAALLTLIIAAAVLVVFSVWRSFAAIRLNRHLTLVGEAVIERLSREIRGSQSINPALSMFDTDPGALGLNTVNQAGQPRTIVFSVGVGDLQITDGANAYPLLGPQASTTRLIFRRLVTPNSEAVKIDLTLVDRRRPARAVNFNHTVNLRGSY